METAREMPRLASSGPGSIRPLKRYIELVIDQDEDGVWCGFVPRLPGVLGDGGNPTVAFRSLQDAVLMVIDRYRELGFDVPWLDQPDKEDLSRDHRSMWLEVHA